MAAQTTLEDRLEEVGRREFVDVGPLDALANIKRFTQMNRFAYGENYNKFLDTYSCVADTLTPQEFDIVIKKTYSRHEREILRQASGYPIHKPHRFQRRMLDEINMNSYAIRNTRISERRYKERDLHSSDGVSIEARGPANKDYLKRRVGVIGWRRPQGDFLEATL